MMMLIRKSTESNDNLLMVISGHIGENNEIVESNVDTIIRLDIHEVGNIYDQLLAVGNTADESVDLTINGDRYIFPRSVAIQLIRIAEQVWFDYEIGDTAEHLPEEEWTEEYLLSL